MTRRISLITIVAIAAVALIVPAALAQSEPLKRGLGDFNLIAPEGSGSLADASDRAKPDVPVASLDVFERAVIANQRDLRAGNPYVDAHQRVLGGNRGSEQTTTYRDAFERAAAAPGATGAAGDSHDRMDPGSVPVQVPTVSSAREIEWPQIGIGFAVGILLMLGFWLTVRMTHIRPLAH